MAHVSRRMTPSKKKMVVGALGPLDFSVSEFTKNKKENELAKAHLFSRNVIEMRQPFVFGSRK